MTIEGVVGELTSVVVLSVLGSLGAVAVVGLILYLLDVIKGTMGSRALWK